MLGAEKKAIWRYDDPLDKYRKGKSAITVEWPKRLTDRRWYYESTTPACRFSVFSLEQLDPDHICEYLKIIIFVNFHLLTALESEN